MRSLAVAFGFLTRLPVPTRVVEPRDLARSLTWFPAVGAALGAMSYAAAVLLRGAFGPGVVAAALVTLGAIVTGGLHLDGVADVFDALGGGRGQRDRMLEIMRDSRIGAHGAVALALLLGAKLVAVAELLDHSAGSSPWALYAAPVVARWTVVPLVLGFPYARADGLGKPFHGHASLAQLAGATVTAGLAIGWLGATLIAPAVFGAATALAIALWLHRHLGGLTGDVYGAAIEAAELAFLVIAGLR
jgi:adenosylcobinamide-GDP ribazoletransferase